MSSNKLDLVIWFLGQKYRQLKAEDYPLYMVSSRWTDLSMYLVWLITRYAGLLSARALTLNDFLKQRKCHSITGVNSIIKSFNPVHEKNILFLISVKNIFFLDSVKKNNLILIFAKKKNTIQFKNHPPPGLRMAGPLYHNLLNFV